MNRTVFALASILALAGCTTVSTEDYNLPVHVGMTVQELTNALGKPEVITNKTDGSQVWVYSYDIGVDAKSARYIVKDGKVVEVPARK